MSMHAGRRQRANVGPVLPGVSLELQPPAASLGLWSMASIYFSSFSSLFLSCLPLLHHNSVYWSMQVTLLDANWDGTNPYIQHLRGSYFATKYNFAQLAGNSTYFSSAICLPVDSRHRTCVLCTTCSAVPLGYSTVLPTSTNPTHAGNILGPQLRTSCRHADWQDESGPCPPETQSLMTDTARKSTYCMVR